MRIKKSVNAAMMIIAAFLALNLYSHVNASDKQGTEGTEMNAYEAEELEVYLGPDWSGKEFKLETDAGIYPNAVTVGEDGVLRIEIGGSKNYKLTIMDDGKGVTPPKDDVSENTDSKDLNTSDNKSSETENSTDGKKDDSAKDHTNEVTQPPVNDEGISYAEKNKDNEVNVEWTKKEADKKEFTVLGIPLKHLIIFIIGMIIAVDGLIVINLIQKRRKEDYEERYYNDEYEDSDDEEYYDDYEDDYVDEDEFEEGYEE